MSADERKSIREAQIACAALKREQRLATAADALQADALNTLTTNEVIQHMKKVHLKPYTFIVTTHSTMPGRDSVVQWLTCMPSALLYMETNGV